MKSSYKFPYEKQKHGRGGRVSGILLSDNSCLIWASVTLICYPDEDKKKRGRGGWKVFLTCSTIEHFIKISRKHIVSGKKSAYDQIR